MVLLCMRGFMPRVLSLILCEISRFEILWRLVEDGWALDDALHEIAVYRDRFSTLLQHQIKVLSASLGFEKKRPREVSLDYRSSFGRDTKGKGKGNKGKGKYGKGKSNPGAGVEPCRRFAQGTCFAGDSCRFSHS